MSASIPYDHNAQIIAPMLTPKTASIFLSNQSSSSHFKTQTAYNHLNPHPDITRTFWRFFLKNKDFKSIIIDVYIKIQQIFYFFIYFFQVFINVFVVLEPSRSTTGGRRT